MLDFTAGEGAHKKFFATGSQRCADIYFFRRSLSTRVLLLLHSGLDGLSRTTVAIRNRLGWKARVKKFIRSRA